MKKITILGSNSGRNAGDAAILASIISEIREIYPEVQFEVPTTNPGYIAAAYPRNLVRPVSVMPWNLSLRLLGLPVFNSIRRTDLTLITNGIIFDYRLFNLAFNFVPSLVCLVFFANFLNKPIGCYDVGIGPVRTKWGRRLVKFLCNRLNFIMVREKDSYRLLEDLGVEKPQIDIYADVVFRNKPSSPRRVEQILREENISKHKGLIGLNLTIYIAAWLKESEQRLSREDFMANIARSVDHLIEDLNVEVLFITTQIMDIDFAEQTMRKVKDQEKIHLISNRKYTHHDIMGVMGKLDLFIGMRLHSLIMASAVVTPVIGLVYAPKVKSFVELLGNGTREISLSDVSEGKLVLVVKDVWNNREEIKKKLEIKVEELKGKVRESTKRLVEDYLC